MIRLVFIFLVLLGIFAASLFWSGGTVAHPADFTFINRGEIGTLDPNRISWVQDIRVADSLWEGLYTLDPKTLQPIPGCADRIEISPDKMVYTFHIRPDAKWSNGDPVQSADFIFAWRRMLEEPGDYTSLLHCIRGAADYQAAFALRHTDAASEFSKVGMTPIDSRTLRVTLIHPVAYFPDLCAFCAFFPLHEKSMAAFYRKNTHSYDKQFTRPPHLVSNGPYRLAEWDFKRRLRLEANEYYWDRENVKSRVIEVLPSDDPLWSFVKYDSGAADWMADITGEIASELRAKARPDLHTYPGFGTYFYSVNCLKTLPSGQPNPFADPRVRQAFAMAIDKRVIVEKVTRLGESPADTYIPTGVFAAYTSPVGLSFNIAKARQLLAAAGYPDGRNFPPVSLLFNSGAHHGDVAQVVRRQWLNNLGIDVKLEQVEVKIFRQRLHNKDYTLARASWIGDYNDPSTFTDKYRSSSENNDAGWQNAEYDHLCDAATIEPDPMKRLALFTRAEQLLLDDQPIIPLYFYVNACLFRDTVTGIPLDPRNWIMLKSVQVRH